MRNKDRHQHIVAIFSIQWTIESLKQMDIYDGFWQLFSYQWTLQLTYLLLEHCFTSLPPFWTLKCLRQYQCSWLLADQELSQFCKTQLHLMFILLLAPVHDKFILLACGHYCKLTYCSIVSLADCTSPKPSLYAALLKAILNVATVLN